ncbi:MAG: 30S ribosomal protein S11 [bacterium]|nr:30S ribosomal protein S11 [bacterium]
MAEKKETTEKKVEKKVTKSRKRQRTRVLSGRVYIQSTYNNTIISATDAKGNVLAWSSAGRIGYSGAKKATPYAAQEITRDLMQRLEPYGMKEAIVFVKGIGSARESAIRALGVHGLVVTSIKDITPIPHNGTRPPRPRRV